MTGNSPSGQEHQPDDSVCRSCGRFVGPATRCKYCGAPIRQRISLRFFRWAAVLLATIGLAILYVMSIMRDVPHLDIGAISNTMNFAYINVVGQVPQSARVYRSGDIVSSVGFTLDDGTGRIPVRAYGKRARELVESGRLPRAGDRISMDGSLNVSAEDAKIYLQVPESLEILERKEIERLSLAEVNADRVGELVEVSGRIAAVDEPGSSRRPWLIALEDDSGGLELVIWDNVYQYLSNPDRLREGAMVALRGEVSEYKGQLRVELKRADALEFKDIAPAANSEDASAPEKKSSETTPLSELDQSLEGELVTVEGRLGEPVSIKGGVFYRLYDESGRIKVVLWDNRVLGGAREQVGRGANVRVTGTVDIYKDKLEIVPRGEFDIDVLQGPGEGGRR